MTSPQPFEWTGSEMRPLRPRQADREFVVGQKYILVENEETSSPSRRHYFATLRDIWMSLPEDIAQDFQTVEDLRHRALIMTGWCNSKQWVVPTKGEAIRLAAALRDGGEYAIVNVSGCVVTRLTPKSQAGRAMKHKEFQASKDSVLGWCADLIGVKASDLMEDAAA